MANLHAQEYASRHALFEMAMGFVADCGVEGDYLEFGGASGGSLISAFLAASSFPQLRSMHFFVFDSFEGLPEPKGIDAGDCLRYHKGEYACTLDRFRENVSRSGVDLSRVTCVPGWYRERLTDGLKRTLPLKKTSVVLVDCDLFESTVPVLTFITPYIQDGTVMIFDDWFSFKGRLDRGRRGHSRNGSRRSPTFKLTNIIAGAER